MDNLCNCTKNQQATGKKRSFWRFLLIYTAVFLGVAIVGLTLFWCYIDAYEDSRTKRTIETYIEDLTPQYIYEHCGDVLNSIDPKLQSAEERDRALLDFLDGNITYARKASECTDERIVYVLRRSGKIIGKVELEPQGQKRFGFTPWKIARDSFDLSCLLGDAATVTVDSTMQVYAGDVLLDESYVTQTVKYAALEDYYDLYSLPCKLTYSAGPIFGQLQLRITDADGNPVDLSQESDSGHCLNNCSPQVHQELDSYIRDFIDRYTRYLTSRLDNRQENYSNLSPLLLRGSDLYTRVNKAFDGLQYGQSKSDTITDFVTHSLVMLEDGKYLCDVTYEVDTLGRDGSLHHSVNNAYIFLVRTDSGLKAERLVSY